MKIEIMCPSRGHGGSLPQVDFGIRALPGVAVVLMDTAPKEQSGILLSDNTAVDRPDSGVVLSAGDGTGLKVGEHVLVPPFAGVWYANLRLREYKLWEVRFYGIADVDEWESVRHKMSDIIPASLDGGVLKPKADWCLIKRDSARGEQGGIYLPDSAKYRTSKATVKSVGPDVVDVKPGMKVIYHGQATFVGLKNLANAVTNLEGDPDDYCLIKESGIYAEIC